MNAEYYKEYYTLERKNWYFIVRYKIIDFFIKKYLPRQDGLKILNIGAATGRSSEILMKYGDVKSLEYDKDCCKFTKEMLNIDIVEGSILALPYMDESFDVVCAFDVLEHIEDDQLGANEMKRVCKKDGLIFITVPMNMALWGQHDVVNQHYRRYKKAEILKLFQSLKKVHSTFFNSMLFIPIYLFRRFSGIFKFKNRKGSGSDFSVLPMKGIFSSILFFIFNFEYLTLKYIRYPFGVSFFSAFRK